MAIKFSGNVTMTGAMTQARGWSPDSLSPAFWFDAYEADTLTLGTANVVDQWNDKSGNGLIGTAQSPQADVNKMAYQPTALNGRPALYCDGTNYQSVRWDTAVSGGPPPPNTRTAFIVHQWQALGGQYRHFMAQSDDFHAPTSDAYFGNLGDRFAYNGTGRINGTAVNMTNVQRQLTPSVFQMTFSAPAEFHGMSGGTPSFPTRTYLGWVSEVVAFEEVLSQADIERLEGYLAHKWGFGDQLDVSHPYRLAPPPRYTNITFDTNNTEASNVLSNGDLTATKTGGNGWVSAVATEGKVTGKWAFEVTDDAVGGFGPIAGIGPQTPGTGFVGNILTEYGIRVDGLLFNNNANTGSVALDWSASSGTPTVMILVDLDGGSISAVNNGSTVLMYNFTPSTEYFPMISNFEVPDSCTINFGATAFVNPLPAGYSSWDRRQRQV